MPQPTQEVFLAVGLGEEVVRPAVEPPDDVPGVREGGEHHHRNLLQGRVRLQVLAQLEAVHAGHHHVGDDHRGALLPGRLQARLAVPGPLDLR